MSREFKVELNFGYGYEDITSITRVKEFYRQKNLYNNLKPTVDNCSFYMKYDQSILSKLLLTDDDIKARVRYMDGTLQPYFQGFVEKDFDAKSATRVKWVEIQLIDNNYLLDKTVDTDLSYSDMKLFDYTDKDNSLIHQVLYECGVTNDEIGDVIAYKNNGTTKVEVDYFTHFEKQPDSDNAALSELPYGGSYKQLIENILFQYGYTYYFDDSGKMQLFNFRDTNVEATGTINNTNMIGTLNFNKKSPAYKRSQINWKGRETVENQIVWVDNTGQTSTYRNCNIVVGGGEYYPATASSTFTPTTYFNFTLPDGRGPEDVIAVTNIVYDFDFADYIHEWTTERTVTPTYDYNVYTPVNGWIYDPDPYFSSCYNWTNMLFFKGKLKDNTNTDYYTIGVKGSCQYWFRIWPFPGTYVDGYKVEHIIRYWGQVDTTVTTETADGTPYTVEDEHAGIAYSDNKMEITFSSDSLSFDYKIYNKGGVAIQENGTAYTGSDYDGSLYIRKLEVRGDCILKGVDNIYYDDRYGSNEKSFKYTADYIYTENEVQDLAEAVTDYFVNSTYKYVVQSQDFFDVGDWVLLTDNNFENVDNFPVENKRCLIVSRKDEEYLGKYTYSLEEFADYEL